MFRHLSGKFVSNGKYTLVKPFSSQHLAKKKKCFCENSRDREIISKEVQVRSRVRFSSESSGRSDIIFFAFSLTRLKESRSFQYCFQGLTPLHKSCFQSFPWALKLMTSQVVEGCGPGLHVLIFYED